MLLCRHIGNTAIPLNRLQIYYKLFKYANKFVFFCIFVPVLLFI